MGRLPEPSSSSHTHLRSEKAKRTANWQKNRTQSELRPPQPGDREARWPALDPEVWQNSPFGKNSAKRSSWPIARQCEDRQTSKLVPALWLGRKRAREQWSGTAGRSLQRRLEQSRVRSRRRPRLSRSFADPHAIAFPCDRARTAVSQISYKWRVMSDLGVLCWPFSFSPRDSWLPLVSTALRRPRR
jgi:hypothetical protein